MVDLIASNVQPGTVRVQLQDLVNDLRDQFPTSLLAGADRLRVVRDLAKALELLELERHLQVPECLDQGDHLQLAFCGVAKDAGDLLLGIGVGSGNVPGKRVVADVRRGESKGFKGKLMQLVSN